MNRANKPQRADYEAALRSMDTYIDVSVDDLMTVTARAEHIASRNAVKSLAVSRVMSQPVHSVRPSTPLAAAARLLVQQHISGLPVVDDHERLVGLITEADFLRALGVPAQQPTYNLWQTLESLFDHLMQHGQLEAPEDTVAVHMVRHVFTVQPNQTLETVIEIMKQHRVKRVVVCENTQRVVGMVTRSDLVRVFFGCYTDTQHHAH